MIKVSKANRVRLSGRRKSMAIQCYLLLAVPLIGFFVFTIYPLIWAAVKSFFFYTGNDTETQFVGLKNFITIFTTDKTYWRTWGVTFIYALVKLPVEMPIVFVLAILLNKKLKGSNFLRTLYYVPCVLSVAVVGIVFSSLFDYFGFINSMLINIGLIKEPIEWFANGVTSTFALVLGSTWTSVGINILYVYSALQNVPAELYEAARLDGAGKLTMFWKITLPMIAPVFQFILLLAINGSLHVCDYILATTNGAPGGKTYTVMAYIVGKFVPGFANGIVNIGYGCAISFVTSVICGMVALAYYKLSNKLSDVY